MLFSYQSIQSHEPRTSNRLIRQPHRLASLLLLLLLLRLRPPPTEPLMLLPPLNLTLLPTIPHSPTPRTAPRILLPANLATHLPKHDLLLLLLLLPLSGLQLLQPTPHRVFALFAPADRVDGDDDEGFGEVEERGGRFEAVGCRGGAGETG